MAGRIRERVQFLRREHVPQTDRAGFTGRSQDSAVGGIRQGPQDPHFIPEQAALFAGRRIPERDGTILVGPGERSAVRRKLDRREFLRARQRAEDPAPTDIPEAHRAVAGRGGQLPAIGSEDESMDRIFMSLQQTNEALLSDVPESNRLVGSGRREQLTMRMEGQRTGRCCVSPQGGKVLSGGDVPEADVILLGQVSGGQDASIR